jgi:DNA modification methylase
MEIRKVPVNQINPAPYNPRRDLQPGDPDYEKLRKSVKTFGYLEPLVWNELTKTLVSGHQRLKVLIAEGYKEVEVSVVRLSIEKEKVLNLALNKIRGDWDEDLLARLLQELQAVPDFDMGLTGFDVPEVSELLDGLVEDRGEDDFDFNAAVEAIKKPVTQKGDLIQLGNHRILCGDSSILDDIGRLLGDKKAALLHTDPPYNVDYYGGNRPHAKARPKNSRHWKRIYSDNMTQEQYEDWMKQVFTNASGFIKNGGPIYVWNGHRQFGPMHQILTALDFHISSVITWAKPNFAIGYGDYNQQTEFCLYGWKSGCSHSWYGPTNESTLWEIKRDPTSTYCHPTQKPIALAQRGMRNSSVRSDVVLDLFLGSGSTLIAAESLDRCCYGIEIDSKYCDAIVRRYIAYVGADKVPSELSQKYILEVES